MHPSEHTSSSATPLKVTRHVPSATLAVGTVGAIVGGTAAAVVGSVGATGVIGLLGILAVGTTAKYMWDSATAPSQAPEAAAPKAKKPAAAKK